MHFGTFIYNNKIPNTVESNKKEKPTKIDFIKEVQESLYEIRGKTNAYDLSTHGGFQRAKNSISEEKLNSLLRF